MINYSMNQLEEILNHNIRRQYVKIELLDWYENTTEEITGIVKSGTYSENGSNMSRRNLTLTFSSVDQDNELIINKLQISKKIKVSLGLQNFSSDKITEKILWFNLGIFIPISVSLSHSATSSSISLSCSDKMCLLNGTVGGMIPMPITFATKDDNGNYKSMNWRDIFINASTTIGNENNSKIIIENVPDIIRVVGQVKDVYGVKDKLIHVDAPKSMDGNRCIIDGWLPDVNNNVDLTEKLVIHKGEKLYGLRKFGPPDPVTVSDGSSQEDYIVNVGENISKIYTDIITQLSNAHQCYYDKEGNLRLEPIHDFTVFELEDKFINSNIYETNSDMFKPDFTRLPITYDFSDKPTVISYNNTQKFDNIKNDFVLQGEKGKRLEIVIDHKPTTDEVIKWFKEASNQYAGDINNPILDYCNEGMDDKGLRRNIYYKTQDKDGNDIYVTRYPIIVSEEGKVVKYAEVELENLPWQIAHGIRSWHIRKLNNLGSGQVNQYNINSLYQSLNSEYHYRWGYECEQLIYQKTVDKEDNWRSDKGIFNLYNWSEKNGLYWKTGFSVDSPANEATDEEVVDYTNPNFDQTGDSKTWNYWFDIIDDSGSFAEFGIEKVGRRTYSQKIDGCNMIFRTGYTDLIIIEENYLNSLEDKDFVLKKLRERNSGYAIIKNDSFYYKKIDVFNSDGEIKEPEGFIINEETKNGNPGYYIPNKQDDQKTFVGGMYTGSTDNIAQKSYDLHDIGDNEVPPTFLLFFPQYEAEKNARYVHPKDYNIDITIPKGKQFIEEDKENGEKKKIFGNIVAYPPGYPLDITSIEKPTDLDKSRAENEANSPLMLLYSDQKRNNKLKGFSSEDVFHPCFITIRFNKEMKKYEYWGPRAEGSKEYLWRDYKISTKDSIIAYCVNNKTSDFKMLFNMETIDMSNIISYGSGNDLFTCIQPIIVQKTNTADSISISTLINPQLETNTLVRVSDEKSNIQGIFKITSISYNLDKSTMTIQAVKMNKYLI